MDWRERERERDLLKWDDTTVDAEGVVRWKSNGAVPFADMLKLWQDAGKVFNMQKSNDERMRRAAEIMAQYRELQARRTPEEIEAERAECRAAMGRGVKMVNVITGEKYTT